MFVPLFHTADLEAAGDFRWRAGGILLGGLLLVSYWRQWIVTPFQWDLAIILTFLFGYRTFSRAFRDLLARRISADQAVTVAALAALYVGEYLAAAEVVYIMLVGETLEEYAARRFQGDLKRLLSCLPEKARVLREGREEEVQLADLRPSDNVIVLPGQRLPVDGLIVTGESLIDESTITGESVPREKSVDEEVYAGTLNQTSRLVVKAQQVGENTVLRRIVELVHHAKENKAPIQRTADRYARWFLPIVVVLAAACYLVTGEWMRSVAILIVACPCPMILATPAAVLASVSALARRGIVVKGGVYLERLSEVDCIAFDKTGTLTQGQPDLIDIISFDGEAPEEMLRWAAALESHSDHILARAIRRDAEKRSLVLPQAEAVASHTGLGVEGTLLLADSPASQPLPRHIRVGSLRYLQSHGLDVPEEKRSLLETITADGGIAVLVARESKICGALVLRDLPRRRAREAIHELEHLGIRKMLILTGDHTNSARRIADAVGISEVHANLLPEEKLNHLQQLAAQGHKVAMVGDGINDSPALALAHVGVAMGDTGTDVAAEAAGVVLMEEEGLDRLGYVIQKSRQTVKKIQDNILWFGLAFNMAAVLAAFTGYLSAVAAAIVHQASSLLVLLSSLRLLEGDLLDWLPHRASHRLHHLRERWGGHLWPGHLAHDLRHWIGDHRRSILRATAVAVPLLYVVSGIRVLGPEELGVVQRFGKVLENPLAPGLHYVVPPPFERLHRISPARVESLELGFRLVQEADESAEPPAYEWNIQHRNGRYQRQLDEALMLTGDEYLVEINAVVQYSIENPVLYLFRADDAVGMLRALSEGVLGKKIAETPLDDVLALNRASIESSVASDLRQEVTRLGLGIRIHSVLLQDVHPALEVVAAFREVASALEEKSRLVNEAQAYANERIPLARGTAQEELIKAAAYRVSKVATADGEARRFVLREEQFRKAPSTTKIRLYLETVESGLSGKKKYVLDSVSGRRKVMLLENSLFNLSDLDTALRSRSVRSPQPQ